jgi:glutamine amidotransferase
VIAIVDYGVGNLCSVKKALDYLSHPSQVTCSPDVVANADRIILPGVGHFAATETLTRLGLRQAIIDATQRGALFLGICVGMQWMFSGSEEAPGVAGLGAFDTACARFAPGVKTPHVGWNTIHPCAPSRLLSGIAAGSFVYFTHSFRAPTCTSAIAVTSYGGEFASVVERDNLFGVQFHPEKSGDAGLRLLANFCGMRPC